MFVRQYPVYGCGEQRVNDKNKRYGQTGFFTENVGGGCCGGSGAVESSRTAVPQGEGLGKPGESNPLRLSFQENTAPGETLAERLDYMEAHGVTGFEPGGKNLSARVGELKQALRGRNISVSAICAGFSGFILSEQPEVRAEFDRTMREIIAAAGELGSTGVIMVPAFNHQVPVMPHTPQTRDYLVEQLRKLGDYAREQGTTVILEPLNRKEAHYLRPGGRCGVYLP